MSGLRMIGLQGVIAAWLAVAGIGVGLTGCGPSEKELQERYATALEIYTKERELLLKYQTERDDLIADSEALFSQRREGLIISAMAQKKDLKEVLENDEEGRQLKKEYEDTKKLFSDKIAEQSARVNRAATTMEELEKMMKP